MTKKRSTGSVLLALLSAALCQAEPAQQSLFNGKDLTGWKVPANNLWWKVVDGVLVGENDAKKKGNVLETEASYQDFEFETEVRWAGEIDSGIMVRKPRLQVQIGISRSLKRDMTGSIYIGKYPEDGQAKHAAELIKVGEWTKVRIRVEGPKFTIWLNDQKEVEFENAKYAGAAPIGLQIHPGLDMKVEFRNLWVKKLGE